MITRLASGAVFDDGKVDDDVRSDLRQLHADCIGLLRAIILDTGNVDLAIRFLKDVPCPAPE